MDILQFKNELNFEFIDGDDLMQKLRKFYTADGYTPEISIDGDIIHITKDEKAFRTVQLNFEKAINHVKHALKLETVDYIIDTRCEIFMMMERFQDAIADFTEAIKLNDKYKESYEKRAKCYTIQAELELNEQLKVDYFNKAKADEEKAAKLP